MGEQDGRRQGRAASGAAGPVWQVQNDLANDEAIGERDHGQIIAAHPKDQCGVEHTKQPGRQRRSQHHKNKIHGRGKAQQNSQMAVGVNDQRGGIAANAKADGVAEIEQAGIPQQHRETQRQHHEDHHDGEGALPK